MLNDLPPELLALVLSNLSQADCYHLLFASKKLYSACLPRLYDSIIIDSNNQVFHEELLNFNDVIKFKNHRYKSTVIRTCYGLKHFFKTVRQRKDLIHLINYIRVIKLPDHFIEFELLECLKFLFNELDNLKGCDFQYYSCFINLDSLIPLMRNTDRLQELNGDFTTNITKRKLKNGSHLKHGLINLINLRDLQLDMLSISNFKNSSYLKDLTVPPTITRLSICRNQPVSFPINYSLVNSIGIDFNYLQDCFNKYFYNGMTNELLYDFNRILNRSSHSPVRATTDQDCDVIKNLFRSSHCARNSQKLRLKELKFDGITFDAGDERILNRCCDLSLLSKLTLIDCEEVRNSDCLQNIISHVPNLKELNLDFEKLEEISLMFNKIRDLEKVYINLSKDIGDESNLNYGSRFLQFFKSLNRHKNLTRLVLDFKSENQLKSVPIKILEKKLIKHKKLVKLRITISIKNLSRFIYNVLRHLPALEFLEVVVEEFNVINNEGTRNGSININEDLAYDNDNDNEMYEFNMNQLTPNMLSLNKIKCINRQILDQCGSLKYVKLFNILLTSDNCVKERGLETWFANKLL